MRLCCRAEAITEKHMARGDLVSRTPPTHPAGDKVHFPANRGPKLPASSTANHDHLTMTLNISTKERNTSHYNGEKRGRTEIRR